MEFLRDVIIETGKCKGMDLGRNYKRGRARNQPGTSSSGEQHREGGRDRGVDIASGYDDDEDHAQAHVAGLGPDEN